jgi:glucans biosynthesis protein
VNRRRFVAGSTATFLSLYDPANGTAEQTPEQRFRPDDVRQKARELANNPYKGPDNSLPKPFENLDYDAYRTIRFKPDRALWRGENLPFEVQFFHRGFIFKDRVEVFEVDNGQARPIRYNPNFFTFGNIEPPPEFVELGFSGFRLHAPINRPDYYDEVSVFLGASYFRAVAKNLVYGLSARGLSIGTGDSKGEEFPAFRTFWIEKPERNAKSIAVHALLDSKSAAAAFHFTIQPGPITTYDIELALYPRNDIPHAGIGSLTSMFLFDANDRVGVDDYRPAVHDSDGLSIRNENGEEIWRPLANPRDLQISTFGDKAPRSFGLFQREREFQAYEDIESRFEKRPSAWVQPANDWGDGAIQLVEIPTKEEIHDNIVSFWRPKEPLKAKREYLFRYRLNWGARQPDNRTIVRFMKASVGRAPDDSRRFVLDTDGVQLRRVDRAKVQATVSADKGQIRNLVTQPNPVTGGMRVSFELSPNKEPVIELRTQLMMEDRPISEVWLYRWTA